LAILRRMSMQMRRRTAALLEAHIAVLWRLLSFS
jgi:hypothetical protein